MKSVAEELTDLLALGSGDREHSAELVKQIAAGTLRLPPCFTIKNGTQEQTARAHQLARMLTAN